MSVRVPKDLSDCRLFLTPASAKQRQYEALRAFFVEGRPSREVARDFGHSTGSFQVLCHHFRRDTDPVFFVSPRPGPREQPKKSAARDLIVELRKRNYSVYEISESSKERQLPLSPTAVREVLKVEGFAPLPGAPMRNVPIERAPRSRRWLMCAASPRSSRSFRPAAAAYSVRAVSGPVVARDARRKCAAAELKDDSGGPCAARLARSEALVD